MEITEILLMLLILFAVAYVCSAIFEKFGLPGLIGGIVAGIVLANVAIDGKTLLDVLEINLDIEHPTSNYAVLYAFSELGVIFLLFSVGLETRVKDLLGSGKTAFLVALLGVIVPFVLGFAYIEATSGDFNSAMYLAAAMVATSVGITAQVIKEMHLMDKKESRIIIAAAVIDDVLGMIVLAIVQGIAGSTDGISIVDLLIVILKAVAFVVAVILLAKYGVPRIARLWVSADGKRSKPLPRPNLFVVALLACFLFAWLAELIGLAAIIGAFLAGMLFADYAEETGLMHKVELLTSVLIPFFFLHVGMQVELSALSSVSAIISVIIILILALVSKYLGCGLGAKIGEKGLSKESFNIIGVGMIPRGEVGIIIAALGFTGGILSADLYAVIVVMAVATTIIAPPILASVFKRKYNEHVQYEEE